MNDEKCPLCGFPRTHFSHESGEQGFSAQECSSRCCGLPCRLWSRVRDFQAEVERLRVELADTRDTVALVLGRWKGEAWEDVGENDVDFYLKAIRKIKAAEAAGGPK